MTVSTTTTLPSPCRLLACAAFAGCDCAACACAGPKRLVLRRTLFIPKSPTEQEELGSTALTASAHYMAFQDAVFQFTHGMYR